MLFAYWLLPFLSKWKTKSLQLAKNRIMKEFEFEQCLETMAVLAHNIR